MLATIKCMGRLPIVLSDSHPYHIYGRSNNKEWFNINENDCWDIFSGNLFLSQSKFNIKVHSFLLMSNHYHLTVTTPQSNISDVMREFLTQISKAINLRSGRINHVFGGRYKWKIIYDPFYYYNVHKYIYRNPVEANVTLRPETYYYSTVHEHLGVKSRIKIEPSPFENLIPDDKREYLDWLNQGLEKTALEEISKVFKMIKK